MSENTSQTLVKIKIVQFLIQNLLLLDV